MVRATDTQKSCCKIHVERIFMFALMAEIQEVLSRFALVFHHLAMCDLLNW